MSQCGSCGHVLPSYDGITPAHLTAWLEASDMWAPEGEPDKYRQWWALTVKPYTRLYILHGAHDGWVYEVAHRVTTIATETGIDVDVLLAELRAAL
jgi:hypothetical protein